MEVIIQHLRHSLRLARRSPAFTAVAVISLALGIGANAVLFSIVHAVLLRPLPYPDAEQLVRFVRSSNETYVTIPEFEYWKQQSTSFESIAAYRSGGDANLNVGGRIESASFIAITTDFFRTFGVPLALGREFSPEEARVGGAHVLILTHGLWQRAFAGDPGVLGRSLTVGDTRYAIVGVLPAGFWFPQAVDAFAPLQPGRTPMDTGTNTNMIGRLKPGVNLQQVAAATAALAEGFRSANLLPYPLPPDYQGLKPVGFQAWLTGDVHVILSVLFGAVGVLLVIACLNIAGLILARFANRHKEIGVRLALGSTRRRLFGQFLVENLVLSIAGGAAALVCAVWLLPALLALIPFELRTAAPITLGAPVLAFTLGVSLASAFLFSLTPFLTVSRKQLSQLLNSSGRISAPGGPRQRARAVLVMAQVALSAALLSAAVLLTQSMYRLHRIPLGFVPKGLIAFRVTRAGGLGESTVEDQLFQTTLLERLRSLRGVESVAAANSIPFNGPDNFPTQREGHPDQSIGGMEIRVVTPGYFETMQIPVRRGRSFTADDNAGSPPVILVSDAVVRRWWPQENPLGDRVVIGRFRNRVVGNAEDALREVVGVVGDTHSVDIKEPPRPTVYIPAAQAIRFGRSANWMLLKGAFSDAFPNELQHTIAELDSSRRIDGLRAMDQVVASTTADSRFDALLLGSFAGMAVLLAAIGVFGLLSFSVAQRTQEIGTRMALGADRRQVARLILNQGLILITIGLAAGTAAAAAASRYLSSLLFGVAPTNAWSYAAACLIVLLAGALAAYLPARRAARIDPAVALRGME